MDIQTLLRGVDCPCGRHHSCDIDFVAVEKGAIRHLTSLAQPYSQILVVADENTCDAAGTKVMEALTGKAVRQVIFPGSTVLIPNEDAIAAVEQRLPGSDFIVGIGSGVIQDLCKYISHVSGVPYCVVCTAPSMDGYASTGAAMILGGMKVTVAAGLPRALLADTEVLKKAPLEMIQAGYGDIVGKFSALNDWRLSHAVSGEYFCQEIYDLTLDMVHKTLRLAQGLANRDEHSVGVLMEALVIVGIAMSFAGSSRPASGSEHHFSHFFEITGIVHGRDYLPHGIDVAYSTVITAQIREKLLQADWPATRYVMDPAVYKAEMQRVYGPVGASCMVLQEKAGFYKKDTVSIYHARQEQIRQILAEMPSAQQIEDMLKAVGMDMKAFYDLYGHETVRDAIRYAKELKDRYTVLWMYYDLFGGQ